MTSSVPSGWATHNTAILDDAVVQGFPTPQDAALYSMPLDITHLVTTSIGPDTAYVLLAVEVVGTGFYLDENTCQRYEDGSWGGGASAKGGFTDRTLADLRCNPPPRAL